MRIAVAGGTGVVGRQVVLTAERRGHQSVVLTRSTGVDLAADNAADLLAERLAGVDAVVDVSSISTISRRAAQDFFTAVTTTLVAACTRTDVAHLILLSIAGIDDVGFGYYQAKLAQEGVLVAGTAPWSILRSAQFHEFAEQVLQQGRFGPLRLVPQMQVQTVAAAEVAEALVDLVEAGPSGRVPDLAGPEPAQLVDLAREVARVRGTKGSILGVRTPGGVGRAMRGGALLPSPDTRLGSTTFATWLDRLPR